jgi:hypothetical protein
MPASIPLTYAPPALPPRRHFHIFLLPLLFIPASIGSRIYYGDEYGSFVVANLPALPIMALIQNRLPLHYLFLAAMIFNLLVMIFFGHILDRIRLPRWTIFLFPLLLLLAILSKYFIPGNIPPLRNPPPNLEWYPTSIFPAWAWTLYLSTLAAIVVTPIIRALRRSR